MTAFATAGAVTFTGAAAHAAGAVNQEVDLVSVSGNPVVVSSSSTSVSLTLDVSQAATVTSWTLDSFDLYRGSTPVATLGPSDFSVSGSTLSFNLANSSGRGAFHIGNAHLTVNTTDDGVESYTDTAIAGGFRAYSNAAGNLTNGSAIVIRYTSRTKWFTVGLDYFSPTGWKHARGLKAKIQAKSGGRWKTIKTLTHKSNGQAKWTRHTRAKYSYRVYFPGTSTIAGGYSTGTPRLRTGR